MSGKAERNPITGGRSPLDRRVSRPSGGLKRTQKKPAPSPAGQSSRGTRVESRARARYSARSQFLNVGVMEDTKGVRDSITEALTDHEWGVQRVWGLPSALKLAREGIAYFILDIDMGARGAQLGLDVLQGLKAYSNDICVVILSSHTSEYRERALSAGAEHVIPKTADTFSDVRQVLRQFYRHLERMAQECGDALELGEEGEPTGTTVSGVDANEAEFVRLSAEPAWLKEHSGMYAAFVDGRCVDTFDSREACIDALIETYPDRSRFIARVDTPLDEFEIPSILDVEFY